MHFHPYRGIYGDSLGNSQSGEGLLSLAPVALGFLKQILANPIGQIISGGIVSHAGKSIYKAIQKKREKRSNTKPPPNTINFLRKNTEGQKGQGRRIKNIKRIKRKGGKGKKQKGGNFIKARPGKKKKVSKKKNPKTRKGTKSKVLKTSKKLGNNIFSL